MSNTITALHKFLLSLAILASGAGAAPPPDIISAVWAPAFTRDILAIFQKSCVSHHNGEKSKGAFNLECVAGLLKGGQSGEAVVVPGKPDASPLIRSVSDQLEDLEMPPLGTHGKYPALPEEQIAAIRAWIAEGTTGPAGGILQAP